MQFVITNDYINIFIIIESNSEIRDYNLIVWVVSELYNLWALRMGFWGNRIRAVPGRSHID